MHQGRILHDGPPKEVLRRKEELENVGLEAPFPLRIASGLRQKGWSIPEECLTIDDLANEISKTLHGRNVRLGNVAADSGVRHTVHTGGQRSEPRGSDRRTVDRPSTQVSMKEVGYLYDQGLPTERKALNRISLEIGKGDFIGLIGPTGSGKSTLVQHLNGLLFPTSGEVMVEEVNLKDKSADLKKIRQKVGLVFQFPERQLFEDTVCEDVAFGPKNLGLSKEEIESRVRESMGSVGLDFEQFAHRSPFFLSGGEQRKVAIAGILALKPEILVLDEPTCGLDAKSTGEIKKLLKQLNSGGATIILISHNMDLIAELAQKIILLDQGKLLAFCGKKELFKGTDGLKALGLGFPQVVELTRKLRDNGIEVENEIFTEGELLRCFGSP
jgi:energy-coupling factor transport system ATP-binding protein